MVKNNKKLIIKAKSSQALNRLNESVENGSDEKYIFEGVFTACSTVDPNWRANETLTKQNGIGAYKTGTNTN